MPTLFITIRFLDIVDILLVAFMLYHLYKLIKGTVAFNIFMGIFLVYLVWLLVKALNMELISTILGQLFGVGVLSLIIVFQQEIRRFLLKLGLKYKIEGTTLLEHLFLFSESKKEEDGNLMQIIDACFEMGSSRTGVLLVFTRKAELPEIIETGELIDAKISKELLKSIFFKNAPLHDGAGIIAKGRLKAARCILPVTDQSSLDPELGLRHRAAIGITEQTDAMTLIVSEETGKVSIAIDGRIFRNLTKDDLFKLLKDNY